MHGIFAAATDIWLCKLTLRVLGRQYVSTAVRYCYFRGLTTPWLIGIWITQALPIADVLLQRAFFVSKSLQLL